MSAETHVTDPELELDPYIVMDYVDDDERRNVRFGNIWLPYRRVESYVVHTLTPCQDDTLRVPLEASADFDMRTLRDDDIVRINYRFYKGFDVKRIITDDLDGSETLLGSGAIVPHECPDPFENTASIGDQEEIVEKKPFWTRDDSMWALMASFIAFFVATFIGFLVLHDYMEDKYLWYASFQTTIVIEFGMGCLAWVITDRLAAKRTYYLGEQTQTRWKLATAYSIVATLNVALVMYITAKS